MPDTDLIQRLRERKIAQWALAYLAGAWLILQVLSLVAAPFDWPTLVLRGATVALGVGFLAALVVAWYHGEKGAQRVSGVELLMLAGILVLAGAAVAFVGSGRSQREAASPSASGSPSPSPGAMLTGPAAAAEQTSIAVLPFLDMSPGRDQEYFSDGLTEELLATLSKLPELRVAARTSAFAFKGHDVRIDSIGRALRVANVLEGSVRKAGGRVRITAQLIDAASGYHRWSESYDRDLKDVFAVQDEIARAIVEQLKVRLTAREGAPLARDETADPEAHTLVLQAMTALRLETPAGIGQATALARNALKRDPRYARAHEVLAGALFEAGWLRFAPFEQSYREARAEAGRALVLDSTLAGPHVVLGRLAAWVDWQWGEAERQLRLALDANPRLPEAHVELAALLNHLGRRKELVLEARRAVELDPLSARIHSTAGIEVGDTLPDEGLREVETAVDLAPGTPVLMCNLAWQYSIVGRHADALRLARAARALLPRDEFAAATLAQVAARAGQRDEVERGLRELEAWRASPYLRAILHANLGRREQAFRLLDQAVAVRDDWAPELNLDPMLDHLRDDPRMSRLIRKIGLPVLRGPEGVRRS